jgi:hypothetical protein
MKPDHDKLIGDLVADLKPVRRPGRIGTTLAVWLVIAFVYSLLITLATGPMRSGALRDLIDYPLFAGETLLAGLAVLALTMSALRFTIPGAVRPARQMCLALLPLIAWVGVYVVGFWHPVHPVSTLGDRGVCIWQVFLFSLPTLALMLWFARRQFPLRPRLIGTLAGAAAAAIPAALMQFACMYEPQHILVYHLAPMLASAALGAAIGPFVLKVRQAVPRRREGSVH